MIDTYLYLKLCWSEAMGHLSVPLVVADKAMLLYNPEIQKLLEKIYDEA